MCVGRKRVRGVERRPAARALQAAGQQRRAARRLPLGEAVRAAQAEPALRKHRRSVDFNRNEKQNQI